MKRYLKMRTAHLRVCRLSGATILVLVFMLAGCSFGREDWEEKPCIRHLPEAVYIQQQNNPERLYVQAYAKGSGFSLLLYSDTCTLDSAHRLYGMNSRDTFNYQPAGDFNASFRKTPEAYDWKYTDSATGKVALFTELEVLKDKGIFKKMTYDRCSTEYKSWKLNGIAGTNTTPYFKDASAVMNR